MDHMSASEIRSTADSLTGTLRAITRGEVGMITPAQRGYIEGARDGLLSVVREGSVTPPPWTAEQPSTSQPVRLSRQDADDDEAPQGGIHDLVLPPGEKDRLLGLVAPSARAARSEVDRLAELGRPRSADSNPGRAVALDTALRSATSA